MGLNPQVIGKEMPHGFAGCYARQPDMIVNTRPAGGGAPIPLWHAAEIRRSRGSPHGSSRNRGPVCGRGWS